MKLTAIFGFAFFLSAAVLQAQDTNELELLRRQVQQQQQQIDMLIRTVNELKKGRGAAAAVTAPASAPSAEEKKLADQLAAELGATNAPAASTATATPGPDVAKSWSPSQPITLARAGSAYMNISFDALLDAGWSTSPDPAARLELGDHDPQKRGFSLRNAEIALDGAVDPYFKGFANIVFKLDNNNETEVELEEAYLVSSALPANLQLKAGQFFAAFGRQNAQHPHAWAFVDAPVILERAFGPEGLRNLGLQLSWLAPTPFYTEFFLGVLDGQGNTGFHFRNAGDPDSAGVNRFAGRATTDRDLAGPQDLVYTPRVASSFEIGDTQTLVAGLSGAFGPNDTGAHSRTEVYGADLYWKWKPANSTGGFPYVAWQTEGLYGRFGAGADPTAPTPLPAENIRDWGMYSQILWGFHPRWVAGVRGEYAAGNAAAFDVSDPFRGERWRISPVLTFYPSEFSKLRLQYNLDDGQYIGMQHSVWWQLEFLLGAHAAHKF